MRAIDVLPVAARAAEQVRVGDAAGLDRLLQRLRDVVLPDDLIERAGAVAAGEDGVRHREGWYPPRRDEANAGNFYLVLTPQTRTDFPTCHRIGHVGSP